MFKAMDCGVEVNEFELQSRYYVHFRYVSLYLPSYELNSTTTVLYIDPRPSRQSRDAPVQISGKTAEPGGHQKII